MNKPHSPNSDKVSINPPKDYWIYMTGRQISFRTVPQIYSQYIIKSVIDKNIFGIRFYMVIDNASFWFRFNNKYGFYVKNYHKAPLLFSQRNGLRGCKIGKYHFEILKQ